MARIVILLALGLAACGQSADTEEQRALAERDVALVEAANDALPPLATIDAEPLLYPDIEANNLYGTACNYAPGNSIGARVIARNEDGFMKIGGKVRRFAADSGSAELPSGTHAKYTGKEYELELSIVGEGRQAGAGAANYQGTITLRDRWGRVVYTSPAAVQCGG